MTVDFNIHLPPEPDLDYELSSSEHDLGSRVRSIRSTMEHNGVDLGNLMVLDPQFLSRETEEISFVSELKNLSVTSVVDLESEQLSQQINRASKVGIDGIKFHPYHQKVTKEKYPKAIQVAKEAEKEGMWIAICGSYGTKKIYQVNAVGLMIALLESNIEAPIVMLHGGGKLVLDVMSVALEYSNVYFETSFSIPYWNGSSIEQDFAFAMEKIGLNRCLFGSDHPYVEMNEAQDYMEDFFERFGFSQDEFIQFMDFTARSLIDDEV